MINLLKHFFLVTAVAVLMSLNLAYGDDQGVPEATATDANQELVDALKQIREILGALTILDSDEQPKDEPVASTGELTQPFVDAITMLGIRENGSRYLVARPKLIVESFDPERGGSLDRQIMGAVWAWGDGRPIALTEVWRFKDQGLWGHTLISTTPGLVTATADDMVWKPEQPGLQFARFPGPFVPAETVEDRTRQMTQLISRFTGYEMVRRNVVPLRMLPEPLHRYQDEGIDGAIFALANNDSPYGYLFVEAVTDPIEPSYWRYAWAKGTSSPVTIELGGSELLHIPGSLNFQGSAKEPFWVYFRRLPTTDEPQESRRPRTTADSPDDEKSIVALREVKANLLLNEEGHVSGVVLGIRDDGVVGGATDAELAHLAGLHHVESLSVAGNDVTNAGLSHVAHLTKLTSLQVASNKVDDSGMVHLKHLESLDLLGLPNSKLVGDGLLQLSDESELSFLNLNGSAISDVGLEHITVFRNLRELYIAKTDVTDAGLHYLKHFVELRRLALGGTKVGDEGLEKLKDLSSLRQLDLNQTNVTNAGLVHLRSLDNLQQLSLAGTDISDEGLPSLETLANLRQLDLRGTRVSDSGVAELKKRLPGATIILRGRDVPVNAGR